MEPAKSNWIRQFVDLKPLHNAQGGFGTVYQGRHGLTMQLYAIKQIPIEHALRTHELREGGVSALLSEVRALAEIQEDGHHPHVVKYFDCWVTGELAMPMLRGEEVSGGSSTQLSKSFLYIQMELCDPSTLADWITKTTAVDERRMALTEIMAQTLDGLSFIHRKDITHGDLKPSNILVKNGAWKIGDFGLCSKTGAIATLFPNPVGTPRYRAPELRREMNRNTVKSDVFSLGLVFLECFALSPVRLPLDSVQLLEEGVCRLKYENLTTTVLLILRDYVSDVHLRTGWIVAESMLAESENERPTSQVAFDNIRKLDEQKVKPSYLFEFQQPRHTAIVEARIQPQYLPRQHRPTRHFSGRRDELNRMHYHFFQECTEDSVVSPLVVVGFGGLGKSELAKTFAQEAFKEGTHCIWFNCESEKTFITCFQSSCHLLKVDIIPDDVETTFMQVYEKHLATLPILLILDNLEDPELPKGVESLLTAVFHRLTPEPCSTNPIFLLVTSQNREVAYKIGGTPMELKAFTPGEAEHFVYTRLGINKEVTEDKDIPKLCQNLQNFPLALHQAASYIAVRRKKLSSFGVRQYLDLFEQEKSRLMLWEKHVPIAESEYKFTTLTTWNVSFNSIRRDSDYGHIAEQMLQLWAFVLNPDGETLNFLIKFYELYSQTVESTDTVEVEGNCLVTEDEKPEYFRLTFSPFLNQEDTPRGKSVKESVADRLHGGQDDNFFDKDGKVEEVDIEDDTRDVARAILLIHNYSIITVETRYRLSFSRDFQHVSMHKLIPDVIRLSNLAQRVEWSLRFSDRFLRCPAFRGWSRISASKLTLRIQLLQTFWTNLVSKERRLWDEDTVSYLLPELMCDVLAGTLPIREHDFMEMLKLTFITPSSVNDKVTVAGLIVQLYDWHFQYIRRRTSADKHGGQAPYLSNLLKFIQDLTQILPSDHQLLFHSRGLLMHCLYHDMFPQSLEQREVQELYTTVAFAVESLCTIPCKVKLERCRRTFSALCCLGKAVALLNVSECDNQERKVFEQNITCTLTKEDEGMDNSYIKRYWDQLRQYSPEPHEVTIAEHTTFLNELLNSPSGLAFSPPSLAELVLRDIIQSENGPMHPFGLSQMFDVLQDTKQLVEVMEICSLGFTKMAQLCEKQQFSGAWYILVRVKAVETHLWKMDKLQECYQIVRMMMPLGKYSDRLLEPEFLHEWMNDFLQRMSGTRVPALMDAGTDTTWMQLQIVHQSPATTMEAIPNKESHTIGSYSSPGELMECAKTCWQETDMMGWMTHLQNALSLMRDAIPLEGFPERTISSIIFETVENNAKPGGVLLPFEVCSWALPIVISKPPAKFKTEFRTLFQGVVESIKTFDKDQSLELAKEIANVGVNVYAALVESTGREMSNPFAPPCVPQTYKPLLILRFILELTVPQNIQEGLLLVNAFLKLGDLNEVESFEGLQNILSSWAKGSDGKHFCILLVECVVKMLELFQLCPEIQKDMLYLDVYRFVKDMIMLWAERGLFKDIALLVENISTSPRIIDSNLPQDFRLIRVGSFLTRMHFPLVLKMYRYVLKRKSVSEEDKLKVKQELEETLCELEEYAPKSPLFENRIWAIQQCFLRLGYPLREEIRSVLYAQAERELVQLIDDHHFVKIYNVGLHLSEVRQGKLKQPELLEGIVNIVLKYLRNACESNLPRVVDMFAVQGEPQCTAGTSSALYLERVRQIFDSHGVAFSTEVDHPWERHSTDSSEMLDEPEEDETRGAEGFCQLLQPD